jgi:hypothetical protein
MFVMAVGYPSGDAHPEEDTNLEFDRVQLERYTWKSTCI